MGLLSFVKGVGEKLFGAAKADEAAQGDTTQQAAFNQDAALKIGNFIQGLGLPVQGLAVTYDAKSQVARISGRVTDQASREKVVLAAGNVEGVAEVDDQLTVDQAGTPGRFYTVVPGDTLSRIARQHYGNANEYQKIFEANKPMLSHPDKIYPGQVLRIP